MALFKFIVYGQPIPKARARVVRAKNGRVFAFTPKTTENWETMIRAAAVPVKPVQPTEKPLKLEAFFLMARPKKPKNENYHIVRPDLDNLVKSLKDACNGIIYKDDCQICHVDIHKAYTNETPCVEVRLMELE